MRIFVDMDGTLAKWQAISSEEELYAPDYFRNLPPQTAIVSAVRELIKEGKDVNILSCYLADSQYAMKEKVGWLSMYLPELPADKYIFVPCGQDKSEYVPGGVRKEDILLDDYTMNLSAWKGKGVKCLNGINHTRKTWKGAAVSIDWNVQQIKEVLI